MKSVKPGRGPSMMNAAGSVFAVCFGVIWTAIAFSSEAPFFFPLFGICFIGLAAVQAVYNYKNATSKNRYSAFDIVDDSEEIDPLNERFTLNTGRQETAIESAEVCNEADAEDTGRRTENSDASRFCPYCGTPAENDFEFCKKCGRKLPE